MLEVPPFSDSWFDGVKKTTLLPDEDPGEVSVQSLGTVTLDGTIMDSKCFFGVMRPARGMTHKACASLCIRGGIPPSFWVRDGQGRESVMLMTNANGGPMSMDILPLVADPVRVTGEIVRVGDILHLRANTDAFTRIG